MRAAQHRSEPVAAGLRELLNRLPGRQLTPARRRLQSVIVSGSLIVAGLALWYLADLESAGRALLVLASVTAGARIATTAVRSLASRQVSIELLVTIAAVGAIFIGEVWEAAAVTFLFTLGAWLEARTLQATRRALAELMELTPDLALVIRDGTVTEVSPWEVRQDETVIVRPGMRLAVDGEVTDGSSTVSEAAITGEPLPAVKGPGSMVFAGTVNQDGLLQVRATGVGAGTALARIVRRVEEAQEAKAPAQRFIERFAAWYTPAMLVVSAALWALSGDLHLALTMLVISCPGALVISAPVAVVAGLGRAARKGILIRGGEHLERAARIDTVAFDKTGTLTRGEPALTTVVPVGSVPPTEVVHWAAAAEQASEHPLARTITAAATGAELPFPEKFTAVTGKGISALVAGREVLVGRLTFVAERGVPVPAAVRAELTRLQQLGQTVMAVARDGQLLGLLGVEDELRSTTRLATERLCQAGVRRLVMLTGDNEQAARTVAEAAGISEVHAGLLPEEKLERIRMLQQHGGVVAMVGDGINDAPALAAADVGIAMGAAGTDMAIETADIALMTDDLLKLPEAIRLARLTVANIRQNTVIALVTVLGLLAGVVAGQVHMAGGMLIHQASVFLVILNALRLLRA